MRNKLKEIEAKFRVNENKIKELRRGANTKHLRPIKSTDKNMYEIKKEIHNRYSLHAHSTRKSFNPDGQSASSCIPPLKLKKYRPAFKLDEQDENLNNSLGQISLKSKLKQLNNKHKIKKSNQYEAENLPVEGEIKQDSKTGDDDDDVPQKPNLDEITEDLIRVE